MFTPPEKERELTNIIERLAWKRLHEPYFIERYFTEPHQDYATRVYGRIMTFLDGEFGMNGLLKGINYCIRYNMNDTLEYVLREKITDPTVLNVSHQLSPLFNAIDSANVTAVDVLLKEGVATHVKSFIYDRTPPRDDWSPLMFACYLCGVSTENPERRNNVVMTLIRHGCDINYESEKSRNTCHSNALNIVSNLQNWTLISYFLEHCDDEIKKDALDIYQRSMGLFLFSHKSLTLKEYDWNAIRYKKIIANIRTMYDSLYKDESLKEEVFQKVIYYLGYSPIIVYA